MADFSEEIERRKNKLASQHVWITLDYETMHK